MLAVNLPLWCCTWLPPVPAGLGKREDPVAHGSGAVGQDQAGNAQKRVAAACTKGEPPCPAVGEQSLHEAAGAVRPGAGDPAALTSS